MAFVPFSAEIIGDNYRQLERDVAGLFGPAFDSRARRTYVAEVMGADPLDRRHWRFLSMRKDYSRANSKGSRGVRACFLLESGRVYVVQRTESWNSWDFRFLAVHGGEVRELRTVEAVASLSQEAQREWLEKVRVGMGQQPSTPPPSAPVGRVEGRRRILEADVLACAEARIRRAFDDFQRLYVSFSGGKDSTVMLHLVAAEARRRQRKVGLLFIDLEAQYRLTVEHVAALFREYADCVEPYWVALPLALRNAVSAIQPRWQCWEPESRELWVRTPPPEAITDSRAWEWFRPGMEFEEFVEHFGAWYSQGKSTCCFVGIRTQESLNRWRAITGPATRHAGLPWTTWKGEGLFNAYPIYDWATEDLWTYFARTGLPYNALYDRMHQAGLTVHQMRICQPYGDDQRRGLWLYHVVEPETWGRVVARVSGANSGALYAQEAGNILGRLKVAKPEGHTWQSFAELLLDTMPAGSAEHYRNKVAVFLRWWQERGYPNGIPDEAPTTEESSKKTPSWRRVCKALLRHDYWCKGLSFSQTKSTAYEKYRRVMAERRKSWKLML